MNFKLSTFLSLVTSLVQIVNNEVGSFNPGGGEAPPATAPEGNTAPDATNVPEGGVKYEYPEGLEPDYHGNPTLLKFAGEDGKFNVANIMKSYVHLQSQVGKDKMPIPNKDFTEDQWKDTFKKLGLPDSLDKYEVKPKEGAKVNPETLNALKEEMYNAGVLPNQAQKIVDKFVEINEGGSAAQETEYKNYLNEGVEYLQKEWGNAFDRIRGYADRLLKDVASEKEMGTLKEMGYLEDPYICKLFGEIGKKLYQEEGGPDSTAPDQMTPMELDQEISKFYSKEHPYMNRTHPHHASAMREFERLMELKVKMSGH